MQKIPIDQIANAFKDNQPDPQKLQKGQVIRVKVHDLAFGGQGVARLESDSSERGGFVVFVNDAAPGDVLDVRILKRKKSHAEAAIEKIITPSPDRLKPPCPYFDHCGGCNYLHLPYAVQAKHKQQQTADTIRRISGLRDLPEVEPIIASPVEFHYRNKMDFSFGSHPRMHGDATTLGFHEKQDWRNVLDIERCLLHPPEMDDALRVMREFANRSGLAANDPKRNTGFWRQLLMRHSVHEDKFILVFITRSDGEIDFDALVEELHAACPKLKGVMWGLSDRVADISVADEVRRTWGEMNLSERLGGKTFRVSPFSFFQVNSRAATLLYDTVKEFAELDAKSRVLDAYCGTGSIGIYCAGECERVYGIESVRDAIWNARHNARDNGLKNCMFFAGMVRQVLPLVSRHAGARGLNRVIVDPPRSGMHKKALEGLINIGAPLMVYVSCNPATLGRDIEVLAASGYTPTRIKPVDLFPQTYHCEVVIQLKKHS
ncbi:23S rRNA (uracil(1939)-C(5))-methyltransferase RlmD [Candidatus Sumerlaeota bacterium]|nr:23S rRNA (uracil(1939)-C(5))-methyltransferase RlmD [Candidatus Sumerlaeota bacterium]